MSGDSKFFLTEEDLKKINGKAVYFETKGNSWEDDKNNLYLPLYEGRMIWHYNHRLNSMIFADIGKKRKALSIETAPIQYQNANFSIHPNYWVKKNHIEENIPIEYSKEWFLAYRNITGATNERTFIATIIPKTAVGHSINLILSDCPSEIISLLLANFNSIVFDYIVRLKIPGNNLGNFIVEQFPIIPVERYKKKIKEIIIKNVLELVYSSNDIKQFAADLNYSNKPIKWDENRRKLLQSELDAIFAILYKVDENDLAFILNSFKTLERKEREEYGEFRTKKMVINAYNKFSKQKELFE